MKSPNNMNIHELREYCIEMIDNKEEKKKIKRYFRKFIELVIFKMIGEEKFYSHIIMQLKRNITFDFPAPAGVSQTISGYNIYFNPAYLLNFELDEIIAVMIHECQHILNYHIARYKRYENENSTLLNIAADCAINQFIDNLPDGTITVKSVREMCEDNSIKSKQSFEYYVEELRKKAEENQKTRERLEENAKKNKSKNHSDGDEDNSTVGDNKGKGMQNHDSWKESNGMTDEKNSKKIAKEMSNKAISKMNSKERGDLPSHLKELIEDLNTRPIIPWQKELKKYVGSVKIPYKKTMLRRSRRQPKRFDVRGKISDRTLRMGVAIDTSGSMGKKELEFAFNEIFNILKQNKFKLTVIECDREIQRVYKAKGKSNIDLEVQGRGGTSFSPIIEHVNTHNKRLDLLIVFTDGYGERELKEKPKGKYKVIWVLTGRSKDLSIKEPYGIVKELNMYND